MTPQDEKVFRTAAHPQCCDLSLFTDFYELTMLQAYFACGMEADATFSLFVRRLPPNRNFLVACGVEDALAHLEQLHFSAEAIAFLDSLGKFSRPFLQWLAAFRFTGEIRAVAEGTPVFAGEPILEVTAPLAQGQLLETYLMNEVHLQTLLASAGARVVAAARGRTVVDFAARGIHGIDTAVKAARAFYIAGVDATSNVLAGRKYGIPLAGTMAHSFIQAFELEYDALKAFARVWPQTVLLVDTYDTLEGVDAVIRLADELGEEFQVSAIRLDSGDLGSLAKQARQKLDAAGLDRVKIFASGGLGAEAIAALLEQAAPIDGFGVGTTMGVSADAPALDIAYKLMEYSGKGRSKLSTGKETSPGAKQVFRIDEQGRALRDVIGRPSEVLPGRPLLQPVLWRGRRLSPARALADIRAYARAEIAKLPEASRGLAPADPPYPVSMSSELERYIAEVRAALAKAQ
jgi:nicotinate phosphoribosyltransferase